jgi:hypothetical protein
MSRSYTAKANAAIYVLRYKYSHDISDMDWAARYLAESLKHYQTLAALTKDTYKFANSMQTSQRKIPTTGGRDGKPANYHWTQMLPLYEAELSDFQQTVAALRRGEGIAFDESHVKPLRSADIKILTSGVETYDVQPGERVWTDRTNAIESVAPELSRLTGIRFSHEAAATGKYTPIEFESAEPVQVLIGYFKGGDNVKMWLKPPDLETDALAAERGGVEPLILNAATIAGCPAVDVAAMNFPKGRNKLDVRGVGSFVILGVVPQSAKIEKRDGQRKGGS